MTAQQLEKENVALVDRRYLKFESKQASANLPVITDELRNSPFSVAFRSSIR